MPRTIVVPALTRRKRTVRNVLAPVEVPFSHRQDTGTSSRDPAPLDELDRRIPRNPRPLRLNVSEEDNMPGIISLPSRAGSIQYDEDTVQEVVDLLLGNEEDAVEPVAKGSGVTVEDESVDSEPKARSRAKAMRALIERDHADALDGAEVRTHAVPDPDADGRFYAVVSLKP